MGLQNEAYVYFTSTRDGNIPLYAIDHPQCLNACALWVSWAFVLMLVAACLVIGSTSAALFHGLFFSTPSGSGVLHSFFSVLTITTWSAAVCISLASARRQDGRREM